MSEPKLTEGRVAVVEIQPSKAAWCVMVSFVIGTNDEVVRKQLFVGFSDTSKPDVGVTVNGIHVGSPAELVTTLLTGEGDWHAKIWDYGGYLGCVRAEFTPEPK